ncbi:MAG: alkaline phosphatase family protein [Verrucomicrobia bacterium]|nr:alkaline phosphatase family protein [Verrucomicrobiota bacterium]
MIHSQFPRWRLVACLVALAFTVPINPASGAPATNRLVVLISVDGLASYFHDDPKANLPALRKLASEGARAASMRVSLPTVTWPNHTTLVTGVPPGMHGVLNNSYWDRAKNIAVPLIPDPLFNKEEIVKVPTVYDVAKQAGLKTGAIIWPATRGAKTLDWTVPDCFSNSLWAAHSTPSLLAEFREAKIPYERQEEWCKAPGGGIPRDRMYAQMTAHVITRHRPNLMLLHLVEVDHVNHQKGPRSPESYEAVAFADEMVKQVFDAANAAFPGRLTFIVTSDHGFMPYRQQIQANVLLKQLGLVKLEGTRVASREAWALGQFIYVLNSARRAELVQSLAAKLRATEGVESVIEEKDFAKHGLVTQDADPRMPNLVINPKEGYSTSDTTAGELIVTPKTEATKGAHNHDPAHPLMRGSFVAWGAGIKRGATLTEINNLDVAPTIARLLGLEMKDVQGRVLGEFLAK